VDDVLLFELDCADDVAIGSICSWLVPVMVHDRRALFLSPTACQLPNSLNKKIPH
jgi:hypothetical protein